MTAEDNSMADEDETPRKRVRRARRRTALTRPLTALIAGATCLATTSCGPLSRRVLDHTVTVGGEWRIQAADRAGASPEAIATVGFDTAGWHRASVPSTVLATLIRDATVPDPFAGRNLERIDPAPFRQPWWYRTELFVDAGAAASHARLVFEGINYSGEVWLNGRLVAPRSDFRGAFRVFELDVTGILRKGANALAVKVFPPQPGDLTIGFVDWNPPPPDGNMGVWRPVKLRFSGAVALAGVAVRTALADTHERAEVTVEATLTNATDREVEATVAGTLEAARFERAFTLAPRERRKVTLSAADVPELALARPRLWWPHTLGEPSLYEMEIAVRAGGRLSDRREVTFGVRSVSDYVNEQGHRGYKVNGRPVLIRGGGWVDDLFLREDPHRLEAELEYARHMNLNTIRLEGFWGSSERLYELADRLGIMLMAGFSCQWEWENYLGKPVDETYGGILSAEDMALASAYFHDQVTWLRNHPSIFVWVVGSDMLPKPELERSYRATLAEIDPTRPLLVACSTRTSEVSGPTGVKMNGPYDYVTPNYWYEDTERGGAFGFNTETGPGPQPPPLESLERMLPEDKLWPVNEEWEYRCARNEFKSPKRFAAALDARYGPSGSAAEFARKAQVASYEAMRAMFEAFAVRRPVSTGIIQWMYNGAWPKIFWQLYDYYLMPNGAYFGARAACRPRSLIYDYGSGAVWAVNDSREPLAGATAEIRVLGLDGAEIGPATAVPVTLAPDMPAVVLDRLPPPANAPVYFADLRLKGADGAEVARSFYWLSAKRDVLDPPASEWFVTPNKAYADFTALAALPEAEVEVAQRVERDDELVTVHVTLTNRSRAVAFFIELKAVGDGSGETILPVLWDDNYVSLLPLERRELTAVMRHRAALHDTPTVRLSGWNVRPR